MDQGSIPLKSIVTVIDPNNLFNRKQGQVKKYEIRGGKEFFGVNFPRCEIVHLYGAQYHDKIIEFFSADQLRVDDDWRFDIKANNLFGPFMWHHFARIKTPIDPNQGCRVKDCPGKTTHRALINVWGVVHEFDCCEHHFQEFNGTNRDYLPL